MQIKLKDLVNNVENIKGLQEIKFPIKVSYKIKRLVDKLNPILTSYDEKRNELVKEFGEEGENGAIQVTDPEKLKLFTEKFAELLEVEEEIDFEPIKIEEVGNVELEAKNLVGFIFE